MHPSRIFKTPEDLEQVFTEYKLSLKNTAKKWEKIQYVGKDGSKKTDYPKLALSLDGFEVWYYNENKKFIGQYFDNKDKLYSDFVAICSHIRKEIRADQIQGGLLGFYNPSITQRLNNLKEETVNTNNQNIQLLNNDPLDDSGNNGTS
jgi:hypothetical protein